MNDLENPFVAHEKPGFKRVYDQLIFFILYILHFDIYIFFKPSRMYLVISLVEADSTGCFSSGFFLGKIGVNNKFH